MDITSKVKKSTLLRPAAERLTADMRRETLDPVSRAVSLGRTERPKTLQEMLMQSLYRGEYDRYDFDTGSDELEEDLSEFESWDEMTPLSDGSLPVSTPYTDDFVQSHGVGVGSAVKTLKKAGKFFTKDKPKDSQDSLIVQPAPAVEPQSDAE